MLDKLLQPELSTRTRVNAALYKHAVEDPVDRIEDIDTMTPRAADDIIHRRIGAFTCSKCNDVFCEGIACAADDDEQQEDREMVCADCQLRPLVNVDFSQCKEPVYKCDLCCSVAVYRCPDYYQCEKHHSQGGKVVEECPGGHKCPLGVVHPQNAHVKRGFIIGCGCGKCKPATSDEGGVINAIME